MLYRPSRIAPAPTASVGAVMSPRISASGLTSTGPRDCTFPFTLPRDDQPAALDAVRDHVSLLFHRHDAAGLDRPPRLVFLESHVFQPQGFVTELTRHRQRLAPDFLRLTQ